jgi:DNA polymerase-1
MVEIINTADLSAGLALTPDQTSWVYNGLDCAVTLEIWENMRKQLSPTTQATYELSMALQGPILDMNMRGMLVDKQALGDMKFEVIQLMDRLEANMNRILLEGYGVEINWRSPKDMQWFLYTKLRLPIQYKRSGTGARVPTADRQAMEKLSHYFVVQPIVSHLLALRDLGKKQGFLNTDLTAEGRMRTAYNIAGTNTGRLASSSGDFGDGTNNQNVDRRIRRVFVTPTRKKYANLDLSQADSRNVGATCWNRFVESRGEVFAGAYLDACESSDLHTLVTRMSRPELDWPEDEALHRAFADTPLEIFRGKSYRDASKGWGHGSNYLLTPASAAKKIPGATIKTAEAFTTNYFGAFPCIPLWHGAVQHDLNTTACVTTIHGRQRHFFGKPSDPSTHRMAVAYEGQSATADAINHGLLKLWRGGARFPGFQLVNQTHDSVLFEYDEVCEDEILPWSLEALRVEVTLARGRSFIIPTDAKTGWNWGDFNANPAYGPVNPDGLKSWKGHDPRKRVSPYHPKFRFS